MLKKYFKYVQDPLYKNSVFIMLTSISGAGFGFVFWLIAAKLYPKEEVGIATALVSSTLLLANLSKLGLDFSIIRFFPEMDRNEVFRTSATVTACSAIVLGLTFVAGVELWSPNLILLKSPVNAAIYISALLANSLVVLAGITFIALRKAELRFVQSMILGLRVPLLFPFVFFGAMGIYCALGVSYMFALCMSLFILAKSGILFVPRIEKKFLKDALYFSAGNYIAMLFVQSPNQIMPIMVLNVLGAEDAAYYYIAFAISSLLFMVPQATGTSLFVEGSHGRTLRKLVIKSLVIIAVLLAPSVIVLYSLGDKILALIGKDYAVESFGLLRLFALASFFVAIYNVYISIKRIEKNIKEIVLISSVVSLLLLLLSYIFMIKFGIVGVGYAWIAGYCSVTAIIIFKIVYNLFKNIRI